MSEKPTYEVLEKRVRELEQAESERNIKEMVGEKHFSPLFENHGAIMLLIEPDSGDIINANIAAQNFYGYSIKALKQLKIQDINILPKDEINEKRQQAAIKKRSQFEFPHRLSSGEIRTVEVHSSPIVLNDKKFLLSVIHDITERKRVEQERLANVHFLESMDRINRAIQGTNDLEQMMSAVLDEIISIFNCDRAFFINFIDPDLESWVMPMARWQPEYPVSYLNKPFPLDPLVKKVLKAMLDSKEPVTAGHGTPFPLTEDVSGTFNFKSFMGTMLFPKMGDLWELGIHQCSYERIFTTAEKKLFKEIAIRLTDGLASLLMYRTLCESEEKYRTMMESFIDPLYICSPDGKIAYMNPAMIKRIGRDATGEICHSAMHGLSSKCEWCVFDELDGKKIETTLVSPLDNRNYRITHMPLHNQDGSISKMAIYRDITDFLRAVSDKKEAEAQLLQSQKMESIGNLAGGIAHDFNNILSSIIGFTELSLDKVEKGADLEDNLQEVYSAGKRARDLVKQILTFARKSDDEIKPIQPNLIAKEVIQFLRSSVPTTIAIKQEIDSNALIMGNATQMHQIFMNLCTNAAQAMENDGGILEIKIKDVLVDGTIKWKQLDLEPGPYIEIVVSDTGSGIEPGNMQKIFDPYFTTKSQGEGTGLGLAIVHGIVESNSGKITVESTLGKGTIFTLYLPSTKMPDEQNAYGPEAIPSGTERILFVDDESSIAKMGSRVLGKLGYSVTTKTNSVEALELFRSQPGDFDLVISDMTMPHMTGDKLAIELMSIRSDIPVILCTGYSKKMSAAAASQIGIKAFAYKPMVKSDLAKTVRKVLDACRSGT